MAFTERHPVILRIAWSFLITLTLLLFQLLPSNLSFGDRYLQLFRWDGNWFHNIATNGYIHTGLPKEPTGLDPKQENVAFFPGYPIAGWIVSTVGRLSIAKALLFAAFLCCMGMTTYLLLLLRRWQVPLAVTAVGILLFFSYPSAFYLVAPYSESLFFLLLLGLIYFQEAPGPWSDVIAAYHGIAMSLTRILGIPLSLYPLVRLSASPRQRSQWPRFIAWKTFLSATMMLGTVVFFLYLQWKFGNWNLYMETEHIGWKIQPDYFAIFKLSNYQLFRLYPHMISTAEIGFLSIPLVTFWFLILLIAESTIARWRDAGGFAMRRGLYYCAFVIFYLSLSGSATKGMMSIIRYMLGVHLFLVIATMHMLSRLRLKPMTLNSILALFVFLSMLMLKLQNEIAEAFMQGGWVA